MYYLIYYSLHETCKEGPTLSTLYDEETKIKRG